MVFSSFEKVLWFSGFLSHVLLLTIILGRKQFLGVKPFVAYLFYAPLVNVVLFLISRYGSADLYFASYYFLGFLQYPLQLFVIWRLTEKSLAPLHSIFQDKRRQLRTWSVFAMYVLCAFGVSVAMGPISTPGSDLNTFDLWENKLSVFTSLVMCGAIVATFLAANRYYLQLSRHVLAVGQGLFVWSYCLLLVDVCHAVAGIGRWNRLIGYGQNISYVGVLVYWMLEFWKPERSNPALPEGTLDLMKALHQVVREELKRVEHPPS